MTETELRAEVERLTELNDGLANQIVRMSTTLESSRRELLAIGWDAAVKEADRRWQIGHVSAGILIMDNPYRQPLDLLGGAE